MTAAAPPGGPATADDPARSAVIVWRVRRPPARRLVAWSLALAAAFTAFSAVLVHGLLLEPSWLPGLVVGAAIGSLIPLSVLRGATATVDEAGTLAYGFGDRPGLAVPLEAITGWRIVRTGLLHGVGARVAPERVRFLHRKGLSYARLRRYERGLGTALVLEFLTEADLEALRALQADRGGEAAPRLDRSRAPDRLRRRRDPL